MFKCISTVGSPYGPGHINSIRYNDGHPDGNVATIQNTGTSWVRVWVRWDLAQPNPATNMAEAFEALNESAALLEIDAEVKRANDLGLGVILALDSFFPTWANGTADLDPGEIPPGRDARNRFPAKLTADSEYGWFIAYLLARYHPFVQPNAEVGPGQGPPTIYWGNPLGGSINFLDIVNEPNFLHWPQYEASGKSSSWAVAEMMITAEAYAHAYSNCGIGPSAGILAPGCADQDQDQVITFQGGPFVLIREVFNFSLTLSAFLRIMRWGPGVSDVPRVYVGWAHHNYRDIEKGPLNGRYRAERAFSEVVQDGWWDPDNVFLTEGTSRVEDDQPDFSVAAFQVGQCWDAMLTHLPQAYLFTQHTINDFPEPLPYSSTTRLYGMRGDATNGGVPSPPPYRPMYGIWQGLPES